MLLVPVWKSIEKNKLDANAVAAACLRNRCFSCRSRRIIIDDGDGVVASALCVDQQVGSSKESQAT